MDSVNGKGSRQRDVDRKKWDKEYDRIFKERYPDTPKKEENNNE